MSGSSSNLEQGSEVGSQRAPRFSVEYMDRSVDPRKDFFSYCSGEWVRDHPVPPDKSRFGSFNELYDWNLETLKKIAEECAQDPDSADPNARIVGRFYRSAMDTERIEHLRFKPIDMLWEKIGQLNTAQEVARLIPELHCSGVYAFFSSFSTADDKNSSIYALNLYQGGLSLPDRDYYLQDSKDFTQIRVAFKGHVARMFALKGIAESQAKEWADTVFDIETNIAKASRTRTDLRDPEKNYNKMDMKALDDRYRNLSFVDYFNKIRGSDMDYVIVGQPEFLEMVNGLLDKTGIEKLRIYLYWQLLSTYAAYLHAEVEKENFEFFERTLTGQKEQEPRWKRSIKTIDGMVGEALGKLYVDRKFGDGARQQMREMVDDILEVFRERLKRLSWMSEETRRRAEEKLDKFTVKIGHPEKFRDYSSIAVEPADYAGNVMRAAAFELRRQASRAGQAVDRKEWGMTPPTVNAYYSQTQNEIVFPAGILQPPFFDLDMDTAVNYGGIGTVISHEITHGFDDKGRQYDSDGNLKNWWIESDEKEFNERADRVEREYGSLEVLPGKCINGKLTLGENIADLGGVSIAYDALKRRLNKDPSKGKKVDGFSPEQRFFIAWAQLWKLSINEQEILRLLTVDTHSPAKYRASVPAMAHPAFDEAFKPAGAESENTIPRIGVW